MNEILDEKAAKLWKLYEDGKQYQAVQRLDREYQLCVNFYEGKQWPEPTAATRNMPRPMINLVKMIVRSKVAAILGTRAKIVYKSSNRNDLQRIREFNDFADYMASEMAQDKIDKRAIRDGAIKGTYVYHYFWDSEAVGKDGKRDGGLRCELLNPLNVIFSNPAEMDEQRQEWIIVVSRQPVAAVRERADHGIDRTEILPDDVGPGNQSGDVQDEQDGTKLCTVLTRYFRRSGEVYWERSAKNTMINEARALAPDLATAREEIRESMIDGDTGKNGSGKTAADKPTAGEKEDGIREEGVDAPNPEMLDDPNETPKIDEDRTHAYLYPIVVGQYETREGSIYGIGEVKNLIPNQRAINFLLGMELMNVQDMACGKYIVDPQALHGQRINNEPGQVLVDYSRTGNGIRKMTEAGGLSGKMMQDIDGIMTATRSVSGSTEVMTGETLGASMSGAAIAQLQSQAMLPIDDLRDSFWAVKEKQGKVLAQAYILYYWSGKNYFVEPEKAGEKTEEQQPQGKTFVGEDYRDARFDVVAEAVTGTKASAAGDITILDALLQGKYIDVSTYVRLYPKEALTNQSELLEAVESGQTQVVEQLTAENQQLAEKVQEDQKAVESAQSLVSENNHLRGMLLQIYAESAQKLAEANRQIIAGNAEIGMKTEDCRILAEELDKQMKTEQVRT